MDTVDTTARAVAAGRPINVAVVDDHPAIAEAIEAGILAEAHRRDGQAGPSASPLRLVGAARTVEAARALVTSTGPDAPDVVVCDIQVERGLDGLEIVAAARSAGRAVLVLTAFDRSSLMRAAFERGAAGFLGKSAEIAEIVAAIRVVAAGGTAFSAAMLDAARYAPRQPSQRELAVLDALQRGATSEEIATQLGISSRTVESHLRRLVDRYGVVSRTELAVLAIQEGWVEAVG
jgi:two-component system response regulator DesR